MIGAERASGHTAWSLHQKIARVGLVLRPPGVRFRCDDLVFLLRRNVFLAVAVTAATVAVTPHPVGLSVLFRRGVARKSTVDTLRTPVFSGSGTRACCWVGETFGQLILCLAEAPGRRGEADLRPGRNLLPCSQNYCARSGYAPG